MIVDRYVHPERDLYYLGALLIETLLQETKSEIDYYDLYLIFKKKKTITITLYSYTLDWLFLMGVIVKSEDGKIKKCF